MKGIDVLRVVGGLRGFVAVAGLDLVAALFGDRMRLARVVHGFAGVSAIPRIASTRSIQRRCGVGRR